MNALTNSPPAPTTVKRRRWPRYLFGVLLVLIGLPTILYWSMKWIADSSATRAIEEATLLDPDWRLEDLDAKRETLREEENSALQIIKVYGLARRGVGATWKPEFYDQFENLAAPHQLNVVQVELLREAYADIPEAVAEARKLKDMPKGRFALKYSPDWISTIINDQQNARRTFEVLQHDVWQRAQAGDADGAIESCRAALNAARSIGDEPFLISFLIRSAGLFMSMQSLERALAQSKRPSDDALKAMQALIEQEILDEQKHWTNAMRGERAGHERLVRAIDEGRIPASQVMSVAFGSAPGFGERFLDHVPAVVTSGYPAMLRHMNQVVEASKLPLHEQTEKMRELEQAAHKGSFLMRFLLPALQKVGMAHQRNQALLRSAQVAVAAERYRLGNDDRWPESIDALVKAGLLAEAPADPYDGAPLRLKRRPDGVTVYAVGNDKHDNGGIIDLPRVLEPGVDIGLRLWNLPQRRQAPRPPVVKDDGQLPGR